MPANTAPIFPVSPNVKGVTLTTADTSLTAPSTNGKDAIIGSTNGTRIDGMKISAVGTNVTTVLRVFFCDGLGTADTNYTLLHEEVLPATTASTTAKTSTTINLLPLNYDGLGSGVLPNAIKSGQKIVVSLGTTVSSGWDVLTFGGDY